MTDTSPEALDALIAKAEGRAGYLVSRGDTVTPTLLDQLASAVAALRAAPVAMREGGLAYAVADFCEAMHHLGLNTGFGMGDDEELDLASAVWRGDDLVGSVSFHMDGMWSHYLRVGDLAFKDGETPWHELPEGFEAAIRAIPLAASAPPTLAEALTVPEVRALLDACGGFDPGHLMVHLRMLKGGPAIYGPWLDTAIAVFAALANLKGPTP
jgi:hypothetical protein